MKLPVLTSSAISSSSSSWLSPTIISAQDSVSSTTRVLHLAPSRQLHETWYLSLIQEARTWEGNLCLHLQPHPIPWIFVAYPDEKHDATNNDDEDNNEAITAATATAIPTSLQVSEVVWSELLGLIQHLPEQGRGLQIILEKDFIPNQVRLKHLLTVASPSLIRIETNHPNLLPDLVPHMATMCPNLRTLVMEIPTFSTNQHFHDHPLVSLTSFLRDPFCQLKGLHLHFSSTARQEATITIKQHLSHIQDIFATIAECLRKRQSIQALKVSGGRHLDSVLNALLSHHWPSEPFVVSPGSSSLKKLEIESNHLQLVVVQNQDGAMVLHNPCKNDSTSCTTDTLVSFFQSTLVESMTHLIIRVKEIKIQTVQQESTLSKPSLPTILPDSILVSSLTHLTLQAGLTTSMVDNLLVQLQHTTPHLEELDLEGNDMESLALPNFLANDDSKHGRFPNLQRLFLGSNLFTYSTQMEWVERLLYACPRLDIGHRGMPACGILDNDDNENENGFHRYGMKRSLFTSWAHATPLALAWKDWNQHGRYLVTLQHSSLVPCGGGLWPLVFARIAKQFHCQPSREATLLYLYIQSGAILITVK